jgi:recombination protein RecA
MATELEIVKKSGAWFSYQDERMAQGRDAARIFLEANPKIMAEIEGKVRAHLAQAPVAKPTGKQAAPGPDAE